MRILQLLPALLAVASPVFAEIKTQTVEYKDGETVLEGFLAFDDAVEGPRPAVLVVHQWKGLGKFEKQRALDLARLGYVAFAVDIYGKGVRPKTPQEAGAQAGKYKGDPMLYRRRMVAGLMRLRAEKTVDASRIGAIGYCFGGTGVLELARSGANVAGVVSFHGGLATKRPEDAKNIKGKVLVCHGADDPLVGKDEVDAFFTEMKGAKVDFQFIAYGGAVHAFTDPGADAYDSPVVKYHEKAAKRSWIAMRNFFAEAFSG